jgi:hypothetical protein
MKTLDIDYKWSVAYDPERSDRPVRILRHGERTHTIHRWNHATIAMFHALLAARRKIEELEAAQGQPEKPDEPEARVIFATSPRELGHHLHSLTVEGFRVAGVTMDGGTFYIVAQKGV